jgi:hypothetical protein
MFGMILWIFMCLSLLKVHLLQQWHLHQDLEVVSHQLVSYMYLHCCSRIPNIHVYTPCHNTMDVYRYTANNHDGYIIAFLLTFLVRTFPPSLYIALLSLLESRASEDELNNPVCWLIKQWTLYEWHYCHLCIIELWLSDNQGNTIKDVFHTTIHSKCSLKFFVINLYMT